MFLIFCVTDKAPHTGLYDVSCNTRQTFFSITPKLCCRTPTPAGPKRLCEQKKRAGSITHHLITKIHLWKNKHYTHFICRHQGLLMQVNCLDIGVVYEKKYIHLLLYELLSCDRHVWYFLKDITLLFIYSHFSVVTARQHYKDVLYIAKNNRDSAEWMVLLWKALHGRRSDCVKWTVKKEERCKRNMK